MARCVTKLLTQIERYEFLEWLEKNDVEKPNHHGNNRLCTLTVDIPESLIEIGKPKYDLRILKDNETYCSAMS